MIAAMLYTVVLGAVLATSLLSGIFGMAGGMILMAVLVMLLSVANAMILHGAVQATANGSRAFFLRRHIRWRMLPPYILGAAAAVALFGALAFVPDASIVLILVGIFPFIARLNKRLRGLDITRPVTTVTCGFVVTCAQLLAGASGPLLDVFYLNTPLTRLEIVANKAITQALGHITKIVHYGIVIGLATTVPWWVYVTGLALAVVGTRMGTAILTRWNDTDFQRYSQAIILTVAALCIARGVWLLVT
jgi:uncharacterized membrane protein YfcA